MKKETEKLLPGGSDELLCSSIPSRLPDGSGNPEYRRQRYAKKREEIRESVKEYRKRKKAQGNPIKSSSSHRECHKRWRQTDAGKASTYAYNHSEAGKAARAKFRASKRGQLKRHETGEEYAERISRELEEISQHND